MENPQRNYKEIIQFSLLTAASGFIFGDLIIGVFIWLVQTIMTGQWGSTMPLRIHYGIIFGLVGFVIGPILFFAKQFLKKKD